ncbi:hypothetical protein D3C72_1530700 [compost metagenome]
MAGEGDDGDIGHQHNKHRYRNPGGDTQGFEAERHQNGQQGAGQTGRQTKAQLVPQREIQRLGEDGVLNAKPAQQADGHYHPDQHRSESPKAAPTGQQAAGDPFAHARQAQAIGHHAKDQAADENGGKCIEQRHGVAEYGTEHKLIERGQHAHMHYGYA